MRPTDQARQLLRRAQLVLAVLAVAMAVPVGVIVAQQPPTMTASPVTVGAVADLGSRSPSPESASPESPMGYGVETDELQRVRTIAAGVEPGGSAIDPFWLGLAAGMFTLTVCWTLLAIGIAVWRSRLAARDRVAWAEGWARVEPRWSGRD